MADLDGFSIQPDPYDSSAQLICTRCDPPFGDAVLVDGHRDWNGEALADLVAAAEAHVADAHPDVLVLPAQPEAIPYRDELRMGSGGRIVHVATVHRAVCGHSWMEQDTPRGRVEHRCAKDQGIHQDHRCACTAERGAGLDIGDPVVARLSKPRPPVPDA